MNATNRTLSIIAFYLSEYDMDAVEALGFKTRTDAINTISSNVGNGNSYLKLRRDEFDALPDSSSSRKGWRNRLPAKDVAETAAYLHQFSFNELTDIVKSLIENGASADESVTEYSANLLIDTMDEVKLEQIINFSDPTARLVSKTRTGTLRIYNQSIVTQLKSLYRGSCQICGFNPVSDFGVSICEAHHISFFSETQNNDASNIIILCPNHHRLIHNLKPQFDSETLVFSVNNEEILMVKLDYHLKRNKLAKDI